MFRLKSIFHNESGVSLILALMTLLVLSILGVAIATMTFANIQLTATDRDYQSTYYIAEAGVNQAYAEIKDIIVTTYENEVNQDNFYLGIETAFDEVDGSHYKNFEANFDEQPEAVITIERLDGENPRNYQITSEGKIGQQDRVVTKEFTVNWTPKDNGGGVMPPLPEGVGAIVKDKVSLYGSGSIEGDLYLDTDEENRLKYANDANRITGSIYLPPTATEAIFDVPPYMTSPQTSDIAFEYDWEKLYQYFDHFPTAPSFEEHDDVTIKHADGNKMEVIKNGNIYIDEYISDNYELILDQNYHFNEGKFGQNNTLKINIGHQDRVLVFDHLYLSNGHIEIIGSGNLTIFVKDDLIFGSYSSFNRDRDIDQLTLYYEGTNDINFTNVDINANIFVKNADVTFGGGGGRSGLLVSGGEKVSVANGAAMDSVIVAPYADIHLSGNETRGVIIGETLEITGGTILKYKEVDTSKFPFDLITVPNEPTEPGNGAGDGLLTPHPNTG
ncbi:pilus assembly PilX N-terminal domain-containing protein [Amphibacillus sp. Q70]|uniref:pilus assembly PilX N-terminal domain-containing protein n=1 Tax=Amphibacillus sp. Q70 TaxID=3453416 RepID=UPI003F847DE2